MSTNPNESEILARLAALLCAVPRSMGLPQLAALVAVAREPGISVNELAERIDAPQQSASRYASILLGRYQDPAVTEPPVALVEQRVNESDPRKRAIFLTDKGHQLVATLLDAGWRNN